jgi:hypothetical protein
MHHYLTPRLPAAQDGGTTEYLHTIQSWRNLLGKSLQRCRRCLPMRTITSELCTASRSQRTEPVAINSIPRRRSKSYVMTCNAHGDFHRVGG